LFTSAGSQPNENSKNVDDLSELDAETLEEDKGNLQICWLISFGSVVFRVYVGCLSLLPCHECE
jgi:hypothetical protein